MSSLYRNAAMKPTVTSGLSLRSLFACCYGKGGESKADPDSKEWERLSAVHSKAKTNSIPKQIDGRSLPVSRSSAYGGENIIVDEIHEINDEDDAEIYEIGEEDAIYADGSDSNDEDSQYHRKHPFGAVGVGVSKDKKNHTITIHIIGTEIPRNEGGSSAYKIRIAILSSRDKKFRVRFGTKKVKGLQPQFNQDFSTTDFPLEEINEGALRLRLYGCERGRRERLLGEVVVELKAFMEANKTAKGKRKYKVCRVAFEARKKPKSRASSTVSSRPSADYFSETSSMAGSLVEDTLRHSTQSELFVGLAYNGLTGRLTVEVIQAACLKNPVFPNKPPDAYVKVVLMTSNDNEHARCKTPIRRCQTNPQFKSKFMFQVGLFQLSKEVPVENKPKEVDTTDNKYEVPKEEDPAGIKKTKDELTIVFSIYHKRTISRKDRIGWFSIGARNSGEEEKDHWIDMHTSKGQQVDRWHALLDTNM